MINFESVNKEQCNGHDDKEDREEQEELIPPQHLIGPNTKPNIGKGNIDKPNDQHQHGKQLQCHILSTNNFLSPNNRQSLIIINSNKGIQYNNKYISKNSV